MYKKFLVVASQNDKAGVNITTQLSQFRQNPLLSSMKDKPSFDFYLIDGEITNDEDLDMAKIEQYDFIIFASCHKSEKKEKSLCLHIPGNFREANLGGFNERVSMGSAFFQKQFFELLNKNAKEHNLKDFNVTLEGTHHGPLLEKPCAFVEIGSTENEWVNRKAGFVLAVTIRDVIESLKENPYNEIAIAIGGPHYASNFNKIQEKSNYAISHIIPQYLLPLTDQMINEAVDKTEEEVDLVLLDWKGLGNSDSRDQIIEVLEKNYIRWKKVSEAKKEF